MNRLIIQGSARSDGNTSKIVQILMENLNFDLVDLNEKHITPYDYEYKNRDDDFFPIIRDIAENYDLIVFATPVYWYSMSGIMKNFFDRITDCLKTEKETGRKLRGKKMAMISCGSDEEEVEGFEVPFRESAGYLGMEYLGNIHTWVEDEGFIKIKVISRIKQFLEILDNRLEQLLLENDITPKILKEIAEETNCGMVCYLHKKTKEIKSIIDFDQNYYADPEGWEDLIEEIEKNKNQYWRFEQMETYESFRVMEKFAEQLDNDNLKDKLFRALNKRKPFQNFKYIVDNSGEYRQKWFQFRDEAWEQHVLRQFKSYFE